MLAWVDLREKSKGQNALLSTCTVLTERPALGQGVAGGGGHERERPSGGSSWETHVF